MSALVSGESVAGGVDDSFDMSLTQIEDMDPSIVDGFKLIYDREVPLEIRSKMSESDDARQGQLESIKVKMLILGPESAPQCIRLELSSEADLFFAFMHKIDDAGYRNVQNAQKLMVEFADYPNVLIRMLNAIIREPHVHLGIFTMVNDASEAHLDFIQNMEYKFVELMTCAFTRSPEDVVQHQITYRYNAVKQRLAIMQARLFEINNLVKTKNPSLLLHLQKNVGDTSKSPAISHSSPARR